MSERMSKVFFFVVVVVFLFLIFLSNFGRYSQHSIGKIAAHSAYEMFSWYKYLIVSLVFSHLGFWSGNLFLIAPFPDLCLLVPFHSFKRAHIRTCMISNFIPFLDV